MKDFKDLLAKEISKVSNIDEEKIKENLEVPKDSTNGDYAFPCFILAKELKKAPALIATELQSKIAQEINNEDIKEVTAVNGFLNFKINRQKMVEELAKEFDEKKENYGSGNQNKNIVIDYSSPNIATSNRTAPRHGYPPTPSSSPADLRCGWRTSVAATVWAASTCPGQRTSPPAASSLSATAGSMYSPSFTCRRSASRKPLPGTVCHMPPMCNEGS